MDLDFLKHDDCQSSLGVVLKLRVIVLLCEFGFVTAASKLNLSILSVLSQQIKHIIIGSQ